jgi:hypothetical protein
LRPEPVDTVDKMPVVCPKVKREEPEDDDAEPAKQRPEKRTLDSEAFTPNDRNVGTVA